MVIGEALCNVYPEPVTERLEAILYCDKRCIVLHCTVVFCIALFLHCLVLCSEPCGDR